MENVRLGLRNLTLHALRSLLTAMGIILGVAAVIAMVAIGQGAKEQARAQMDKLGATNILARSVIPPADSDANSNSRMLKYGLLRSDLAKIRTIPGLTMVVPLKNTEKPVIRGDVQADANAVGTTPELFPVINLRPSRGQVFSVAQSENRERVAVLGHLAARQLFPYEDPLGQTVQIGNTGAGTLLLTVIGVLEPTGLTSAGSDGGGIVPRDIDKDVYFPLTLAEEQGDMVVARKQGAMTIKELQLSEVWMQAERTEDVERIASVVEQVLGVEEVRDGGGGGRQDVQVKAPIQILRNAERLNRTFNFVMVTIASLSLIVGGIGIMNIMLATVTERTKEIGIRRALGAKRKHITLQFLIETTAISLTGGVLGILLGVGFALGLPVLVKLLTDETGYRTSITLWSIVVSFGVSGLTGILFGLYPAIKAASMSPIDALRHE